MIDHAQAQSRQACIKGAGFIFAGNQHRLVYRVGAGKRHPRCRGLKTIGTAEQVYLPQSQGPHSLLAAGKASYLNRQAERATQNSGNVGGQAFVVATAGGDVEGRVVRGRGTQHQLLFAVDPVPLRCVQHKVHAYRLRAAEQPVRAGLSLVGQGCRYQAQAGQKNAQTTAKDAPRHGLTQTRALRLAISISSTSDLALSFCIKRFL
ncbi:hypothetical protein D3C77_342930 [compost metagenome]